MSVEVGVRIPATLDVERVATALRECGLSAGWDAQDYGIVARRLLAVLAVPPSRGMCWFCKGEFVVDALIAGYDTFEEQRLACLACNERMVGNWRIKP